MSQDAGETAKSAAPSMLATCPDCGDVVIKVRLSRVLSTRRSGPGWYTFDCPMCAHTVTVAAPEHLLSLLTCLGAARVQLAPGERPVTGPAPAAAPSSAPSSILTLDDLNALTAALASTDDLVTHALAD